MVDVEVFVNQVGFGNVIMNFGVINVVGLGGNVFGGVFGNIGVNIVLGNNNEQKNVLVVLVVIIVVVQLSISFNQVFIGNMVSNVGFVQFYIDIVQVGICGGVSGLILVYGVGIYRGIGNVYQMVNYYLDMWSGELLYLGGNSIGYIDLDNQIQNVMMNFNWLGVGGLGFDMCESGISQFVELGVVDLYVSFSGMVSIMWWVNVNVINILVLFGSVFFGVFGNIGVNVVVGIGNLQVNSLVLVVVQFSIGGGGGSGE